MNKLFAWLFLAAIVLGIAGLAVTTERSSALQLPDGPRFNLTCEQTSPPTGQGTKGEVTCSLLIDIPDPLPLPDELKLTIVATYVDNGDGHPSRGDRLQCIKVTGPPNDTVYVDFCRPPPPTPISPPAVP